MISSPLAILFTTVALDLIGFGMVVPLMPLYAQQFGVGPLAISALLAVYSLMQFVFAPLWGQLSDRIGRRPVLLASMAGNVLALLGFAWAQSFNQLLVSRLLAGICTANISVAAAYVADSTTPERRSRGMGLIGAAFGLGFVLGPFFAGELSVVSPRLPPLVAAALGALNLLMAAYRLPESLPKATRVEAARAALGHTGLLGRLRAVRQMPQIWPLLALVFAQIFGFAMMEMALTLMVQARLGLASEGSGRMLAYLGVVLVVVQGGLVGRLSKRLGDVALLKGGMVLMALGLALVPYAVPWGLVPLLIALAILAVGQGLVSPSLSALLSRSVPATRQGSVLGLSQSSSAMARVLGPAFAGFAYQRYDDLAPFSLGGVVLAIAALAALRLKPRLPPAAVQGGPSAASAPSTTRTYPC
jgi:DHA1 family tetracycline resistance protein-like MFS transporter